MRSIKLTVLFAFILFGTVGCASRQAAQVLNQANASLNAFGNDFTSATSIALEREWELLSRMRTSALLLSTDVEGMTGDEAFALVERQQFMYRRDVESIESQMSEFVKALDNLNNAKRGIAAVAGYNTKGVQTDDVVGFIEEVAPSLISIIEKRRGDPVIESSIPSSAE